MIMRKACVIAANVLEKLCRVVREGISTWEIDQAAKEFMAEYSVRSASYKYKLGNLRFPSYICTSVNDEVIHGIGSKNRILKAGDIVSMDVCVIYKGFAGDNARTIMVGDVAKEVVDLVETSRAALFKGIEAAVVGNRVGDISAAIQACVEKAGYGIVKEFTGHGVGRALHEEPQIPNYGRAGTGALLKAGMTLAIEPMITLGSPKILECDDGWTIKTKDGKASSHSEHTILVTESAPEILTIADI